VLVERGFCRFCWVGEEGVGFAGKLREERRREQSSRAPGKVSVDAELGFLASWDLFPCNLGRFVGKVLGQLKAKRQSGVSTSAFL
jgi:hypothetical protein